MRLSVIAPLSLLLACAPAAQGDDWQSPETIQQAVAAFVKEKAAALPGERSITVSRIDPRLKLARCAQLEPYLPGGSKLWGNSSIGVRCLAPASWSLYVPVLIRVTDNVLVTLQPIPANHVLQADDVGLQQRDITQFAGSALTTLEQAAGKTVLGPLASGTILRAEMLRAAKVVRQGQSVKLVAQGNGFTITSEGQSMSNASLGEVVTVKTRSGQLLKGIAKGDGLVEVNF